MEEWKIRLRQAREAKGLNKTEFAKAVGVSNPTVTDWEKSTDNGGIRDISGVKLAKVAEVLGVGSTWILTGKNSEDSMDYLSNVFPIHSAEGDDPGFIQIPMVKLRLSAGMTGFQTEPDQRGGGTIGMRRDWVERSGFNPTQLVAIRVKGESMEPALYEDDIVVINTADKQPVDGVAFAINYEGEAVVKRFSRDAGDWWLMSDNPDQRKYHRKVCRGDACIVIGRVVLKESKVI